jgi:hypothetical protein
MSFCSMNRPVDLKLKLSYIFGCDQILYIAAKNLDTPCFITSIELRCSKSSHPRVELRCILRCDNMHDIHCNKIWSHFVVLMKPYSVV